MRIVDVRPYVTRVGHRNQLLVAIETTNGIVGWGESGYTSRERSVLGVLDHIKPWLVGRDPRRRESIFQEVYRSGYFEGGRSLTAAAAAIDIALYDLLGKSWNVPAYDLLGGASRDIVRCFAHIPGPITEDCIPEAVKAASAGWGAIRFQIDNPHTGAPLEFDPGAAMEAAVKWLPHIRREVKQPMVIGIHGHHRFNNFEAVSLIRRLPPESVDYIEDPIRSQSVAAYQALRQQVDLPFAFGAEFPSKWEFAPFIESGLCNLVRVDVGLLGLTEAKKVSAMAEAHYLDIMPHNPLGPIATAAAAHLAMAVPNHSFLEIRESPTESLSFYSAPWFESVLLPQSNGNLHVPSSPGLGVTVDEARIPREVAPNYEEPHWHRPDGSYANW